MAEPYRDVDADRTERVALSTPRSTPPSLGIARSKRGALTCNGRELQELLDEARVGTPAYVYDLDAIGASARAVVEALGTSGLCCYAIKANGAPPIVARLIAEGCGVDVVSGGELQIALACGAKPSTIVYSGVAKRDEELDLAIARGIRAIHVESVEEIERVAMRARAAGKRAVPIGLRVNPSVEVDTHDHIATGHDDAKFGIARDDLPRAFYAARQLTNEVRVISVSAHVGSQVMTPEPYVASMRVLCEIAKQARAQQFPLEYVDAGGGMGVAYRDGQRPMPASAFISAALAELEKHELSDLSLVIEPGRALVGAHGVLVSRVIQSKRSMSGGVERRWLLIDAGMNDLIRPALYQAHHRIEPLVLDAKETVQSFRVAGPVCESSDDFGVHPLPDPPPSIVAIRDVGAYGRSMASTYNTRPIASELFVSSGKVVAVRRAQTIDELVDDELSADRAL